MKKIVYFLILLVLVAACSSSKTKLTDKGRNVQLVDEKPTGCEVVGKVIGLNDFGSVHVARNHARNQAGDLGANYLLIKDEVMNGNKWEVHALAFECK